MKRNTSGYKKYKYGVYSCFTFFKWHKCHSCKKEFRREFGFRILVGPFLNGVGHWIYLCSKCCPNLKKAHEYGRSYY